MLRRFCDFCNEEMSTFDKNTQYYKITADNGTDIDICKYCLEAIVEKAKEKRFRI